MGFWKFVDLPWQHLYSKRNVLKIINRVIFDYILSMFITVYNKMGMSHLKEESVTDSLQPGYSEFVCKVKPSPDER